LLVIEPTSKSLIFLKCSGPSPKSTRFTVCTKSFVADDYLLDADLYKVFVDDVGYDGHHGKAYEAYGISPEKGAVIVVRPDQCEYDASPNLLPC